MTSEQSQQTPDRNDTQQGSTSGKFIIIFVVIAILGFVLYQLTCSRPEQAADTAPQQAREEPAPSARQESAPAAAEEPAVENESASGETDSPRPGEEAIERVNAFLADWKTAWQKSAGPKGDMAAYFAHYDEAFTPTGQSRAAWEKSKTIRNQGKSWIEVWLTDTKITETEPGLFKVTFKQEYSSSNYSDKSTKVLTLRDTDSGLKIIREESQ